MVGVTDVLSESVEGALATLPGLVMGEAEPVGRLVLILPKCDNS